MSQIQIQGGIKVIVPKNLSHSNTLTIYDYFSHDVNILITSNVKKSFERTYNEKNMLMVLPYPGENEQSKWWIKKEIEKLYIVAVLPFFLKKKKKTRLSITIKI